MSNADILNAPPKRGVVHTPALHVHNLTLAHKTKATDASKPLLTVQDVAMLLNISPASVYRLTEGGQLPHFRIRRSVRIRAEDIERYLTERRVSWDRAEI